MKQVILFLFLMTMISIGIAQAQETDEFVDPSLDLSAPKSTSQNANQNPNQPQPENFQPSAVDLATPVQAVPIEETNFQPQPIALEEEPIDQKNSGDVIVEMQSDLTKSYKERRGRHGILFSINYEKYYPGNYFSQYRDKNIEEFLGDSESMNLLGLEFGYKYNFSLGSISILGNYAQGNKSKNDYADDIITNKHERNLTISRYGLSINYAADNLMREPWIVPYGQVGLHQFQVTEDDIRVLPDAAVDAKQITTQIALNYKFGILFQLNWIEKSIDGNTQYDGLKSSGLQNAFIDLYAMTHLPSSETYDADNPQAAGDPDMSTGTEIGVGFKIEF